MSHQKLVSGREQGPENTASTLTCELCVGQDTQFRAVLTAASIWIIETFMRHDTLLRLWAANSRLEYTVSNFNSQFKNRIHSFGFDQPILGQNTQI